MKVKDFKKILEDLPNDYDITVFDARLIKLKKKRVVTHHLVDSTRKEVELNGPIIPQDHFIEDYIS